MFDCSNFVKQHLLVGPYVHHEFLSVFQRAFFVMVNTMVKKFKRLFYFMVTFQEMDGTLYCQFNTPCKVS